MKLEQSENIRLETNTKIDDLTNLITTQNENIEEIKKEKKYQTQEFNDKIKYIYETLDILINKGDNSNNVDQPDDNLENHNEEKSTSEKYNSDSNNGSIILGLDGMISVSENDDKMSDIAKKFSDFKYSTDDSDKILDIILKK